MALTPFDMEGVNRDLLAAGNPAKPDMQSILRSNARDRVAGVADVIGSDAFADEMRRFLPAGLMTSTVESPRWSAWAIEQIGTLYGTPGTPSSADAVPGFPIFGASNDSSPTR